MYGQMRLQKLMESRGIAYEKNLPSNLKDPHRRLREGRYVALPVRRKWIDKEDGRKRPLGIPTLEDKIVQLAVGMLLEAVYEPLFRKFSYGFRPDRSAHQALTFPRTQCLELNINWIVDSDVFMNLVYEYLDKAWKHWLGRRTRNGYISYVVWHQKYRRFFPLPKPRIVQSC